jgi:hypothetical protein
MPSSIGDLLVAEAGVRRGLGQYERSVERRRDDGIITPRKRRELVGFEAVVEQAAV